MIAVTTCSSFTSKLQCHFIAFSSSFPDMTTLIDVFIYTDSVILLFLQDKQLQIPNGMGPGEKVSMSADSLHALSVTNGQWASSVSMKMSSLLKIP